MCTYVGVRRGGARNWRWIWTAIIGDALGNWWKDLEVGDRSEVTFLRLLERLPNTLRYSIDAYGAYGCLLVNKRRVGKGGAVNRNDGLHSALRVGLNRLVRRTKDYSKTDGMLDLSLALVWLKNVRFSRPARVRCPALCYSHDRVILSLRLSQKTNASRFITIDTFYVYTFMRRANRFNLPRSIKRCPRSSLPRRTSQLSACWPAARPYTP